MIISKHLLESLGVTRTEFMTRMSEIEALLRRNPKAVAVAIVRIYDHQTAQEKQVDATMEDNGIGFQACDAKRGSYYARLIRSGRELFPDTLVKCQAMAIKYRRQLTVLSFKKSQNKE